jgi:hypothetical protein
VSSEAHDHNFTDPAELWKNWNETTTSMVSSLRNRERQVYRDPFGLYYLWMKPITFFEQWHDATSAMYAWMAKNMMNSRWFLGAHYPFIETYMNMAQAPQLPNEVTFQKRQIPIGLDLAHVTKLVVSLEERVYTIEDAIVVNLEDKATDQVVEGLVENVQRIEGKLDALDARFSILQQVRMIGDLAERMERVEDKLNRLLAALEKGEAKTYLESVKPENEDK